MTDSPLPAPSPFITRWARRLAAEFPPGRRALDVACGSGRHALVLAQNGFRVDAIDARLDALREARAAGLRAHLPIGLVCADLTSYPLARGRYHVIVVTRYLDRARFGDLQDALVPGGVLLYETFTEHQLRYNRGPRSPSHLLRPGELRLLTRGMDLLFDEEVIEPEGFARVAVRKR